MTRVRTLLLLLLVSSASLAGCAGGGGAAKGSGPATTSAPAAVASDETGSITGTVVNDELLPIPQAEVQIQETQNRTTADANGRFTFNGLPPASYRLYVAALGYEAGSAKVEVTIGEVSEVKVTLKAIPIAEPRIEVKQHTIMIQACGLDFVGLCDNAATCPDCNWRLPFPEGPSYFIIEIFGKHAVTKPAGKDGLMHYAYKNAIGAGYLWDCSSLSPTVPACGELPHKAGYTAEQFKDVKTLLVYQTCEAQWFCAQEKYDDWGSFFYLYDEAEVPADYSAVPKS